MPIVLYGTRPYTFTRERGRFQCPVCIDDSPYDKKTTFAAFHIYFIPIIPYRFQTYVECRECKQTFLEGVLDRDPSRDAAFPSLSRKAILDSMVLMMLIDGSIDAREVEVVGRIYEKLVGSPISTDEILARVEADVRGERLTDALSAVALRLNRKGREDVMRALIHVALADDVVTDEETSLLFSVADALHIQHDRAKVLWEQVEGERSQMLLPA